MKLTYTTLIFIVLAPAIAAGFGWLMAFVWSAISKKISDRKEKSYLKTNEDHDLGLDKEPIVFSEPPPYLRGLVSLTATMHDVLPLAQPRNDYPITLDPNIYPLITVPSRVGIVDPSHNQIRRNLPPVTQENCMHFWIKLHKSRVCKICAKTEIIPEYLCPNGAHDFQQPIYKKNAARREIVKICKKCDYVEVTPLKTVAELKQSKVRSILIDQDR